MCVPPKIYAFRTISIYICRACVNFHPVPTIRFFLYNFVFFFILLVFNNLLCLLNFVFFCSCCCWWLRIIEKTCLDVHIFVVSLIYQQEKESLIHTSTSCIYRMWCRHACQKTCVISSENEKTTKSTVEEARDLNFICILCVVCTYILIRLQLNACGCMHISSLLLST